MPKDCCWRRPHFLNWARGLRPHSDFVSGQDYRNNHRRCRETPRLLLEENQVSAVLAPAKSPLVGPKILLMGEGGNGKTHSIRTLVDAGIKPFVIALEPGFEVLGAVPPTKLAWRY